jgi:catechol 2,3-dioxygenase-like lactoylglutathione lyase family enzyme
VEEARQFYGALVGLTEIERPPTMGGEGVWFGLGDRELHIGTTSEFEPARKAHPALRLDSDELDDLAARLEAARSAVQWDDRLPGARRFYVHDPWGNRLEFLARADRHEDVKPV